MCIANFGEGLLPVVVQQRCFYECRIQNIRLVTHVMRSKCFWTLQSLPPGNFKLQSGDAHNANRGDFGNIRLLPDCIFQFKHLFNHYLKYIYRAICNAILFWCFDLKVSICNVLALQTQWNFWSRVRTFSLDLRDYERELQLDAIHRNHGIVYH